jgi:hypothetical protein
VASNVQLPTTSSSNEEFFCKGAIAFFVAVIAGFGLIWLGVYLLLVRRDLWL